MARETKYYLYDINPAHLIRECLTNRVWGMGYPVEDIDDDAFRYAADTLYDEEFGVSFIWDRSTEIEEFISEVLRHIDAVLYLNASTGTFILKLIRQDYDINTIPVVGPDDIIDMKSFERRTQAELINTVTLSYKDTYTDQETSITIHDLAAIQAQGGEIINKDVKMFGITNSRVANIAARRELKTYSNELVKITFTTNRNVSDFNVGEVFSFNYPDYNIEQVIMRVSSIRFGTLEEGTITVEALQDFNALEDSIYSDSPDTKWIDPKKQPVEPSSHRVIMEIPYYKMVNIMGENETVWEEVDFEDDSSFVMYGASKPNNMTYHYLLASKSDGEDIPRIKKSKRFTPYGILSMERINKANIGMTLSEISGETRHIRVGSFCEMNGELLRVDALQGGPPIVLYASRGVLDTTPKEHVSGEEIFFVGDNYCTDYYEYVSGEVVTMGARTVNNNNILAYSDTPKDTIEIKTRFQRPYPPGKFKINGEVYPYFTSFGEDTEITWAHRDRTLQTAYIVTQWEDSIGPEEGTTYNLQIFDENDDLIHEETEITETSFTYSRDQEMADSGLDRLNKTLRIKLWSTRDEIDSWDYHEHTIHRSSIYIGKSTSFTLNGHKVEWVAGIE
ncbi:MAG: phage tail protein [archaeon]